MVSGSEDKTAVIWDLWTSASVFKMQHNSQVIRVAINRSCGNIFVLTAQSLHVYDINGQPLASVQLSTLQLAPATCMVAVSAPEWEEDAVVAATGHSNGAVTLWRLVPGLVTEHPFRYTLQLAQSLVPVTTGHSAPITALAISRTKPMNSVVAHLRRKCVAPMFDGTNVELLVGDAAGVVFRWVASAPEMLPREDLEQLVSKNRTHSTPGDPTDLR